MAFAEDDVPRPVTALSMLDAYHSLPALSLGCPILHAALGDAARGLSPQGVTEISGESSSGKTQLCMTLAVRTVMQALLCPGDRVRPDAAGLNLPPSDVLFVNTEDRFPTPRLHQIAEETAAATLAAGYSVDVLRGFRAPAAANEAPVPVPCGAAVSAAAAAGGAPPRKRFASSSTSSSSAAPTLSPEAAIEAVAATILSRIMLAEVANDEELLEVLVRAPGIAHVRGTRLLIVDSIAALFRGEIYGLVPTAAAASSSSSSSSGGGGRGGGGAGAAAGSVSPANTYAARAARLSKIASTLKSVQAACPHIAVVVTNQVADVVLDEAGRGLLALLGGSGRAASGAGAGAGVGTGTSKSSSSSLPPPASTLPPSSSFAVPVPGDGDRLVRPALGPSWDAMVTTRVMLTHLRGLLPVEVPAAAAPPLPLERGALPLPEVLLLAERGGGRGRGGDGADRAGLASSAPGPTPSPSLSFSGTSASSAAVAAGASAAGGAATAAAPALDDGSSLIAQLAATSDTARTTVREAHLLLSPAYPRRRCRFAVVRGGLRGIASSGDAAATIGQFAPM